MIALSEAKQIARMLSAVGEPTRMAILHELAAEPRYVGELSEKLDVPMVNMSHHLGVLKQAGIVENTRNGRRIQYALHSEIYTPDPTGATIGSLQLGIVTLVMVHQQKPGRSVKENHKQTRDTPTSSNGSTTTKKPNKKR